MSILRSECEEREFVTDIFILHRVPVEELRLRLGSSQWTEGGVILKARELIDYHYYSLIILEEDVEFTDTIAPIEFSDDVSQMGTDSPVKMVGWGQTSKKSGKIADNLLYMTTGTVSDADCQQAYEDVFDEVPDNIPIFCLLHPAGYGVFDETESLAVVGGVLQGFGVYREETETMEHPALFVHVSIFVKKVRKTIRKYSGASIK